MAAAIAIELSKVKKVSFYYCFEKEGLLKDINNTNSIIPEITISEIQQLKEKQIITDGMLAKTDNIIHALENGVEKVILCHAKDVLSIVNENAKFGTTFTKN
jgi:acetylglutamate kinase